MSKQKKAEGQEPFIISMVMTVLTVFFIVGSGTMLGLITYVKDIQKSEALETNKVVYKTVIINEKDESKDIKAGINTGYEELNWETYIDEENGFEFKYPDVLEIQQDSAIYSIMSSYEDIDSKDESYIRITHSIPYEHQNSCCFGQEECAPTLEKLKDFDLYLKVENTDFITTVKNHSSDYIEKYIDEKNNSITEKEGEIEKKNFSGIDAYIIYNTFEGCGYTEYFLLIDKNTTLYIRKEYITELILSPNSYSSLENIIDNKKNNFIVEEIFSSFKFIKTNRI